MSYGLNKYDKKQKLYGNWESKRRIDNPLLTSPGQAVNYDISDIGERLIDYLSKVNNHFASPIGSKKCGDLLGRIFKYSTGDNNKLYSVTLLAHDLTNERRQTLANYFKEEYNCSFSNSTENFIWLGWDKGIDNIIGVGEMAFYIGDTENCYVE